LVLTAGGGLLLYPLSATVDLLEPIKASNPETIAALNTGIAAELGARRRYSLFGRLAREDGYTGIAYLYTALAASEQIHADNYARILNTLGATPAPVKDDPVPAGNTKDNLIYAAERELHSIENVYPEILERLGPEGMADAITAVQYSWASHKQHLDLINKIRRWSPGFFETVARKIDENTDRYYVCGVCGSTVNEIPEQQCPVCTKGPENYRLVALDELR
jgi:rubrerythrin